jgi:hypothetical protein
MAVFWVVATHRPDDGGTKDLRNVGKLLPHYHTTTLHGTTTQKISHLRTHRRENLKFYLTKLLPDSTASY